MSYKKRVYLFCFSLGPFSGWPPVQCDWLTNFTNPTMRHPIFHNTPLWHRNIPKCTFSISHFTPRWHWNIPQCTCHISHNTPCWHRNIPQCTCPLSHNTPSWNRNVNIYISVPAWCIVGYGTGALWDLWDWSVTRGRGTEVLTAWGKGKMAAVSQTTFSSAFPWMKMFKYSIEFHWNVFLRV